MVRSRRPKPQFKGTPLPDLTFERLVFNASNADRRPEPTETQIQREIDRLCTAQRRVGDEGVRERPAPVAR